MLRAVCAAPFAKPLRGVAKAPPQGSSSSSIGVKTAGA